ncbi:MAG: DUF2586 family protein [Thermaurantimonas sp.]|uniref:DUF2586 family protein n=1 Tax=Thermaurantimonas sp. TaxID=2681568 RepID=UPI00391D9D6B
MLPGVKILLDDTTVSIPSQIDDGVVGVLCWDPAISWPNYTHLLLRRPLDLTVPVSNQLIRFIDAFYSEAPEGTKLHLYKVPQTMPLHEAFNIDNPDCPARRLIELSKGEISMLTASYLYPRSHNYQILNGVCEQILSTIDLLDSFNQYLLINQKTPVVTILPALRLEPTSFYLDRQTEFVGLATMEINRTTTYINLGYLAGRIARIPVQRSIMRVKDGPIRLMLQDEQALNTNQLSLPEAELLFSNKIIFPYRHVGLQGWYWMSDQLLSHTNYGRIQRARVFNKAMRVVHRTLLQELSEEIPLTEEGTLPAMIVKALQAKVEAELVREMTSRGNISTDPDKPSDTGVRCYIDEKQKILNNNKLEVQVRIRPFGYSDYIEVKLGYEVIS